LGSGGVTLPYSGAMGENATIERGEKTLRRSAAVIGWEWKGVCVVGAGKDGKNFTPK